MMALIFFYIFKNINNFYKNEYFKISTTIITCLWLNRFTISRKISILLIKINLNILKFLKTKEITREFSI